LRNIVAVVVGYLIFAVSALLLFKFADIDPHAEIGTGTKAAFIAFGIIFSFIGGYLAKLIAATSTLKVNFVLALLMAGFATFSFFKSPGEHYTQIAAIFLFAPVSIIGGIVRK